MTKKLFLMGCAAVMFSSCQSLFETARTENVTASLSNVTVADLEVYPERIEATIDKVTADLRRGGDENVKRAVEAKALKENGRGDLLVEPQYIMEIKRGLSNKRITSISVSGRPASFKNFRSLDDSVWVNPVFRGVDMGKHRPYSNGEVVSQTKGNQPSASSDTEKSEEVKAKRNWRPRGVKSIIDVAGFCSMTPESEGAGFDLTYTLGYQFNRHWYVGVGSGYNQSFFDEFEVRNGGKSLYYEESYLRSVPVFVQARWYFLRTQATPYLGMKLGYNFSCYNTVDIRDGKYGTLLQKEYDVKDKFFGGPYVHPSLGIAISTKKGRTVDLSFFYALHSFGYSEDDVVKTHRVGASLGVTF